MIEREKTRAGDPILRHSEPKHQNFEPVSENSHFDEISNHIEKYIGTIESVIHEIVSSIVHIDILYIKPSDKYPFHILVTSGMSDKPMTVPEGAEDHKFAELLILLPKSWPLKFENYSVFSEEIDEKTYWPIRWLKTIAMFPHSYDTWVGWGHTIPNGDNAEPFAENTRLGCLLLMPSISIPIDFYKFKTQDEKIIEFLCLYPLYKEEMEYKFKNGTEKLLDRFDKYGIKDIIEPDRPNTCIKKGPFGLW
jgi:hypothetical protein